MANSEENLLRLDQAVRALANLVGQMLAHQREGEDPRLTQDEGHELLDFCLGELPPEVRKHYFSEVDRYFPTHSTEQP